MTTRFARCIVMAASLLLCSAALLAQSPLTRAQDNVRYVPRWDRQQSGVDDDLRAVSFVDPQHGWAVGNNNTILRTTDGGDTWTRVMDRRERGPDFDSIQFLSQQEGWVQSRDILLHTTNGGDSWQSAAKLARNLDDFGAGWTTGATRFQVSRNTVYRSDDGGQTWTSLPARLTHNDYEGASFTDPGHGWIERRGRGGLAYTDDGGATWHDVGQSLYCCGPSRIQFVNPTTGWAFGEDASSILSSTDGGHTWQSNFTGVRASSSLTDMQFLNTVVGYVLLDSDGGIVIMSADGGQSWIQGGSLGASAHVRGISFADGDNGWVVGDKGFIIHYHLVPVIDDSSGGDTD